jgi:nucleoside-diphosphate-sugar epimerase
VIHGSRCAALQVEGTANIVEACRSNGIPSLVFTSSASVAYTSSAQVNVSEGALPTSFW